MGKNSILDRIKKPGHSNESSKPSILQRLKKSTPISKNPKQNLNEVKKKFGNRLKMHRDKAEESKETPAETSAKEVGVQNIPAASYGQYILFIENLPAITQEQVHKIFSRYGEVKTCFLDDNKAYITFASKEIAIETNYKLKYEKQLRINEQPI
jgi:hypothetical protein